VRRQLHGFVTTALFDEFWFLVAVNLLAEAPQTTFNQAAIVRIERAADLLAVIIYQRIIVSF